MWVLSATVWPLKTTFGVGKTGNNVSERRLTSNATITIERCDILCKILQKGDKSIPASAYVETGSRNMTESALMNSQYSTSFSTLIQYMDLSATVWPLKTTSGFGETRNGVGERRLTSNKTVTVERCEIWCKRLEKRG